MNSRKIILAKNPKLANSRNSRKFLPKISRIFPLAKVSSAKVSSFKVSCFVYICCKRNVICLLFFPDSVIVSENEATTNKRTSNKSGLKGQQRRVSFHELITSPEKSLSPVSPPLIKRKVTPYRHIKKSLNLAEGEDTEESDSKYRS